MATTNFEWLQFFESAGVPSNIALKYAKTFMEHRIQSNMLGDLDKDLLKELGITAAGDVIGILKKAKEITAEEDDRATLATISKKKMTVAEPSSREVARPSVKEAKKNVAYINPKMFGRMRSDEAEEELESVRPPTARISRREPHDKGDYSIKMPQGTTAKSQALLKKAALLKAKKEMQRKSVTVESFSSSSNRTVFSRLGGAVRAESGLRKKNPVTFPKQAREHSPEISSTTGEDEDLGTLESDREPRRRKTSALERLGSSAAKASRQSSAVSVDRPNFTVVLSGQTTRRVGLEAKNRSMATVAANAQMQGRKKLIALRRVTASQLTSVEGTGIKARLGAKVETSSGGNGSLKGGVFSRLG